MLRAITALSAGVALLSLTTGVSGNTARQTKDATSVRTTKIETCNSVRQAIRYYRGLTWQYQDKLKQKHYATSYPERRKGACAYKRYVVGVWKDYLVSTRNQWNAYLHDYAWWKWLPYEWQARSRCELGYELQARSWRSNVYTSNGNFQGFVNFYNETWDGYKLPGYPSEAYYASPRQQYTVALAVARDAGLGAWQSCATP